MPDRYDRQKRVSTIGTIGQRAIEAATVLIAGTGALGTYAAEQLARAGVGRLLLVDPDVVSISNLQRQTLFEEADVGDLKVQAAKTHLQAINRTVEIDTYPEPLTRDLLRETAFDVVLDCLDNYAARDLLNQAALAQGFDYIFASCAGNFGSVMAISPTAHACLNCVYPNLNDLKKTDCDLIGVNTALVPLVSAMQVSLALHYFVAPDELSFNQMHTIDNWAMTQQAFKVEKSATCPMCHRQSWPDTVDTEPTLKVLCGTQTYQTNDVQLPTISQLSAFLTARSIPFKHFKAFISFEWHGYTISCFKNQKMLLYGLPDLASATTLLQELTETLQREVSA